MVQRPPRGHTGSRVQRREGAGQGGRPRGGKLDQVTSFPALMSRAAESLLAEWTENVTSPEACTDSLGREVLRHTKRM